LISGRLRVRRCLVFREDRKRLPGNRSPDSLSQSGGPAVVKIVDAVLRAGRSAHESSRHIPPVYLSGDIEVGACHDYGCAGSMADIYTSSMPVFVVQDRALRNVGHCNFYEGEFRHRLNYGVYNEEVYEQLDFVRNAVADVVGAALEETGEIELRPVIRHALHMGDELHSRNTAATILLTRELFPGIVQLARDGEISKEKLDETLAFSPGE
jgi:hypothetical protein